MDYLLVLGKDLTGAVLQNVESAKGLGEQRPFPNEHDTPDRFLSTELYSYYYGPPFACHVS